jgi:hypothetical protein
MNARSTSKARATDRDTLRAEYRREDLGPGVRGKYHDRFAAGTNIVLLAPDVARVFTTPESVNQALRGLIGVATKSVRRVGKPSKRQPSRTAAAKRTRSAV